MLNCINHALPVWLNPRIRKILFIEVLNIATWVLLRTSKSYWVVHFFLALDLLNTTFTLTQGCPEPFIDSMVVHSACEAGKLLRMGRIELPWSPFCGCEKMPRPEQLTKGRVYFSSQFNVIVYHRVKFRDKELEAAGHITSKSREKVLMVTLSYSLNFIQPGL